MKNAVISFGLGVCLVLFFIIHSIITAKDVTANEAEKSLNTAIEYSLNAMTIKPMSTMNEMDEFVKELGRNITAQLSSDSDLEISLIESNWNNGNYKLGFKQTIGLANGNTSEVYVEKTIQAEAFEQSTERQQELGIEVENINKKDKEK